MRSPNGYPLVNRIPSRGYVVSNESIVYHRRSSKGRSEMPERTYANYLSGRSAMTLKRTKWYQCAGCGTNYKVRKLCLCGGHVSRIKTASPSMGYGVKK